MLGCTICFCADFTENLLKKPINGAKKAIAAQRAAIAFLKAKITEVNTSSDNSTANRIRWEVAEAVEDAVTAVNQTFVEELKNKNLFDKEKQEEAFERALEGTIDALSRETVDFINNTYGDINIWLIDKIEAAVSRNKK
jgi:DNA gyrase/topoisomerase IV subunit B